MKKIFTQEDKNNLLKEVQRLEDFAMQSQDDTILGTYFPHTIYELDCALVSIIWKEVEYIEMEWFKKINSLWKISSKKYFCTRISKKTCAKVW